MIKSDNISDYKKHTTDPDHKSDNRNATTNLDTRLENRKLRLAILGAGGIAHHCRWRGHRRGAAAVPRARRTHGRYRGQGGRNCGGHRRPSDGAVKNGACDLQCAECRPRCFLPLQPVRMLGFVIAHQRVGFGNQGLNFVLAVHSRAAGKGMAAAVVTLGQGVDGYKA